MSLSSVTLPEVFLLAAAGIAAGSLVLAAIGLVAAWTLRRRSLPMRHGLLLATLVVVALLPVLIPWRQSQGLGWDLLPKQPGGPRTFAPLTATIRQDPDSSTTLELPTDGSLQTDGMTVAEVMARYGEPTAPAARTSIPAATQHEWDIDVRRLTTPGANILCLAWLAGSCFSLIRALQASRSLGRWMRRAAPVSEPHVVELLNACASDAGLARWPALVGSSDATVPYVLGLWRPRIVLPASLLSADEPTLRGILLHELAHIRRRDLWVGLLQRCTAAMYWWNPLVHRLNARLAEVREDLCDNYVLAHISDPRDYAQTLVDLASQAAAARVVPSMGLLNRSRNRLSGRIQRILQEDRPMATRLGGVSKVLLVVFVFALGAGSMLFVIRLPDILPEHGAALPAVSEGQAIAVDSPSEPTISLVRHDSVASNAVPESANWDVVVLSPVVPSPEAADLKANAVESDDQVVPAGNAQLPIVPDVAFPAAFADQPVPQDPGPAPGDLTAPASAVAPPLDSPTTGSVPAPLQEPVTSTVPFSPAFEEPRPTGNDPFSSAPGLILSEPSRDAETLPSSNSVAEPATPPKALVLVELTANADGSVKQFRYLTEELGNDDAAFQKLEKQIVAWAGQFTGGDLTVQIVADPQLRYEHVARVTKLCSPLVTRVVLAQAETKEQVTITVGFVRDAEGQPVVATPVVFWQDEVVRPSELQSRLEEWKSKPVILPGFLGDPRGRKHDLKDYTVVLRCDNNVEYTFVESIMKAARQAGFEHFRIAAIDATVTAARPVRGFVLDVDKEARIVHVSIGEDDGLRPGQELTVERPPAADDKPGPVIARLEVTRVLPDSAECRIVEEDLSLPILIEDFVQTITSPVAPIAKPDPSRF